LGEFEDLGRWLAVLGAGSLGERRAGGGQQLGGVPFAGPRRRRVSLCRRRIFEGRRLATALVDGRSRRAATRIGPVDIAAALGAAGCAGWAHSTAAFAAARARPVAALPALCALSDRPLGAIAARRVSGGALA